MIQKLVCYTCFLSQSSLDDALHVSVQTQIDVPFAGFALNGCVRLRLVQLSVPAAAPFRFADGVGKFLQRHRHRAVENRSVADLTLTQRVRLVITWFGYEIDLLCAITNHYTFLIAVGLPSPDQALWFHAICPQIKQIYTQKNILTILWRLPDRC